MLHIHYLPFHLIYFDSQRLPSKSLGGISHMSRCLFLEMLPHPPAHPRITTATTSESNFSSPGFAPGLDLHQLVSWPPRQPHPIHRSPGRRGAEAGLLGSGMAEVVRKWTWSQTTAEGASFPAGAPGIAPQPSISSWPAPCKLPPRCETARVWSRRGCCPPLNP